MAIVGSHFSVSLQLAGLPDDAILEVRLPSEAAGLGQSDLLDWVFPLDEDAQLAIQDSFDLEENPDLPEIYESLSQVMEQARAGLCRIAMSAQLASDGPAEEVAGNVPSGGARRAEGVSLLLTPVYDALGYAAEHGYDAGEPDLLEWLQLCAAVYFLDKHEAPLPDLDPLEDGSVLKQVVQRILSLGLAGPSQNGNSKSSEITAEGRRFISGLLAETENYIDFFDIFKDVAWDDETGRAIFGAGHGDDLRVEAFIAEAIDPVRAVFLLRLYDGLLDEFAKDWQNLVSSPHFYNGILLPVVDRSITPADLLEEILDQGLSLLEDSRQLQAERDANARIAGTLRQALEHSPE